MAFELFKGLFGGDDYYGSKPTVPKFNEIKYDPDKQQRLAIKGNLKSFGQTKKLANRVNVFNESQLRQMLERAIPLYQEMVTAGSQRTMDLLENKSFADMLAGRIPDDVAAAVQDSAAAKAIGGGYSGSQLHGNLVARDLGLTSLDLIQKGAALTSDSISAAERWMTNSKALAVPNQFNVESMFLSPQQRLAGQMTTDAWNSSQKWNRDWLKSQVEAAPNPAKRGRFDSEFTILGMAAGMMGGAMGGMMGGGGGGGSPAGGGGGGTQPPPGGGGGGGGTAYNNTWRPDWNSMYA